ncbi:MAG: NADH-quinone oxidoreductase subunit J [Gammaproteobacteria bacterium]|nr:NADH-quinone oxidoreductase subunit J [Gammaproteobacteria bacterium]
MSMESILFYLFATVLVVSAAMVVTIRNPVKAALFLVLSFFSAACIWMTLEAEFLSIALVLVYVGAVMVLFLFVVMMLDIDVESMREGFARNLPVGALVAGVMVVEFAVVMMSDRFDSQSLPRPAGHGPDYSNTKELGLVLYTDYVFAFEVAGLILLVAIVAAIVLTMRRRPNTRYQSPSEQVKVNKSERLRIVSMPAEKRLDIDN